MPSAIRVALASIGAAVTFATAPLAVAQTCSQSASELVRQARAHEERGDTAPALRRYTEALGLDRTCGDAYLGLGALRMQSGDPREAERVYTVAIALAPSLAEAYRERAGARWALGRRDDAHDDMRRFSELAGRSGLESLAAWYGQRGFFPAQLAVWRRLRVLAATSGDNALLAQATVMVRALQALVSVADPVTYPARMTMVRSVLAQHAGSAR